MLWLSRLHTLLRSHSINKAAPKNQQRAVMTCASLARCIIVAEKLIGHRKQ